MRHLYFNLKDLFSNRKGFVILTSLFRFKNKSREFREYGYNGNQIKIIHWFWKAVTRATIWYIIQTCNVLGKSKNVKLTSLLGFERNITFSISISVHDICWHDRPSVEGVKVCIQQFWFWTKEIKYLSLTTQKKRHNFACDIWFFQKQGQTKANSGSITLLFKMKKTF